MLADTDAGNVVTAAQAGAQQRYRLLPLLLLLIPVLYMVQELTVRLGIHMRQGFGELVRSRHRPTWAWVCALVLGVATASTLVTEFSAIVGVGELYSMPRLATLSLSVVVLLAIGATGSYRRIERVALLIGVFVLAFFVVSWAAHPNLQTVAMDAVDPRIADSNFGYLGAALIGACFNPWMIFYQQSATVEKRLAPGDTALARWDTAFGASLTQCLTASVLVAAAATLASNARSARFETIGEISRVLSSVIGEQIGHLVFGVAVLGAAMVAAIVASLAFAWGVGELSGYKRTLEHSPFQGRWFYALFVASVSVSALLVAVVPDLLSLNIGAQVLNAFLLPVLIWFLVSMAVRLLPETVRLKGTYLYVLVAACVLVIGAGVIGGLRSLAPSQPAHSSSANRRNELHLDDHQRAAVVQQRRNGASTRGNVTDRSC
jgi:Mn2+/Fe2+ NRAMP family transporter